MPFNIAIQGLGHAQVSSRIFVDHYRNYSGISS